MYELYYSVKYAYGHYGTMVISAEIFIFSVFNGVQIIDVSIFALICIRYRLMLNLQLLRLFLELSRREVENRRWLMEI